jgi:hypothetical protein
MPFNSITHPTAAAAAPLLLSTPLLPQPPPPTHPPPPASTRHLRERRLLWEQDHILLRLRLELRRFRTLHPQQVHQAVFRLGGG